MSILITKCWSRFRKIHNLKLIYGQIGKVYDNDMFRKLIRHWTINFNVVTSLIHMLSSAGWNYQVFFSWLSIELLFKMSISQSVHSWYIWCIAVLCGLELVLYAKKVLRFSQADLMLIVKDIYEFNNAGLRKVLNFIS